MCGSWDQAVKMWAAEEQNYNFNRPGFGSNTGHFTQTVWIASKRIGFGSAPVATYGHVYVAQFDPPGNVCDANNEAFRANVHPGH